MFLWCICCVCFPAQLQLATVLDHLAALGNSPSNFSRHCNSFSRGDNVNARQILRTQRGYLHRNHWLFKQIINAISSLDISNQSIKWRGTFCVSAKIFQCPFLDYTVNNMNNMSVAHRYSTHIASSICKVSTCTCRFMAANLGWIRVHILVLLTVISVLLSLCIIKAFTVPSKVNISVWLDWG